MISIITVCLNEIARIRETVDSIASQTFRDFEWIVIDGGSTDGTLEALAAGARRADVLVSERDAGIYDAMNKGIARAQREYLLFLNGGDRLYEPRSIELATAKPWHADIVTGRQMVMGQGRDGIKDFSGVRYDRHLLYRRAPPHGATFIRRRLFQTHGLYDSSYRIMGDREFFTRVLLDPAVTMQTVDATLSVYHLDGISSRLKHSPVYHAELRRVRARHFSPLYRLWRTLQDRRG